MSPIIIIYNVCCNQDTQIYMNHWIQYFFASLIYFLISVSDHSLEVKQNDNLTRVMFWIFFIYSCAIKEDHDEYDIIARSPPAPETILEFNTISPQATVHNAQIRYWEAGGHENTKLIPSGDSHGQRNGDSVALAPGTRTKSDKTLDVCLSLPRLRNCQCANGAKLPTKSIHCQPNVFPCGWDRCLSVGVKPRREKTDYKPSLSDDVNVSSTLPDTCCLSDTPSRSVLFQRPSSTLSLVQRYLPPLFMKSTNVPASTLFPPYLQLLHQQQH